MGATQAWKDTVSKGINDARWDEYDDLIKKEVDTYNIKFKDTTNFIAVDWHIVKAMLWVESGGPDNPAWKTRPMQIGNKGDPAYDVLREDKEGSDEVMSKDLRDAVKDRKKISTPNVNIRASIAYLFTRMAKFENKSVPDTVDTKIHEYIVKAGDSLDKIAHHVGSTVEEMTRLNPGVKIIHPKQKLKYVMANIRRVIVDWRKFQSQVIADRYNVGDADYSEKLNFVFNELFPKLRSQKK